MCTPTNHLWEFPRIDSTSVGPIEKGQLCVCGEVLAPFTAQPAPAKFFQFTGAR